MKVLDVSSLQDGIDFTVQDIESKRDQIQAIQKSVHGFHTLEDDLRGQGGEAIRAFYRDAHEPFLVLFHQFLIDYSNLLKDMKEAVGTFESNSSGYVNQEFLETDVDEGFAKVEKTATELTDDANEILADVEEIVSVKRIDESEVVEDVQRGKEKAKEIVEELTILDEYEAGRLEETKQALHELRSFISGMESMFKSGDLSIRNYNVEMLEGMPAYNDIMDRINNKDEATISAMYGDNIDEMPMYEIEKMHNNTLDKLSEESQKTLNDALNELKNGNIDRQDYLAFVRGLPAYEEAVAEANTPGDLSFYNLPDSVQTMLKTTEDVTSQVLTKSLQELGIIAGEVGVGAQNTRYFKRFFSKIGRGMVKGGKFLHGAGTALGFGTMAAGFGLGMYEDMHYKDKTAGEAVAHNATSLGVGVLGNAAGVGAAVLLGSNPVGWAAIATGIVVGVVATGVFNWAYSNIPGLEEELDYIGQKLDQAGREVKEMATNFVENTGEAIKSGWEAINPMNWGWG